QPQETASRSHTFKNKSFKKSKICGICKQVIDSQGISCRAIYLFNFSSCVMLCLIALIAHRNNRDHPPGCTDYRDSAASGIAACSLLLFCLTLLPCCVELIILASSPWDTCG
ncbi:hypothetical protein N301_00243, partial [Charadrius vociferus]